MTNPILHQFVIDRDNDRTTCLFHCGVCGATNNKLVDFVELHKDKVVISFPNTKQQPVGVELKSLNVKCEYCDVVNTIFFI